MFHYSANIKAESATWKHSGFPVKEKFKTTTSSGRAIATVLWDMHCVLLANFTLRRAAINVGDYQGTH
jgi:hypothetical protein